MIYNHCNQINVGRGRLRWEQGRHGGDIYDVPLKLLGCGMARWGRGEKLTRRKSALFGVEVVTHGNAKLVQNGHEYLIGAGEAYLLHKNSSHEYGSGSAGYVHKRYVSIDGSILEPLLRATGLKGVDRIVLSRPGEIIRLMREAFAMLDRKEAGFGLRGSELAYRLLIELGRDLQPQYPASIRRALDFMGERLSGNLSRAEMAEAAGLSETHFNRLFKECFGVTPVAWFIGQKIEMAKYLLRETGLSVKEVAVVTGFKDALYFSAQFKKYVGVAPKFYLSKESAGKRK